MADKTRICAECGEKFEVSKYQHNRQKYCSIKCASKANFKKSHKYEKVCPVCNLEFKALKKQVYCSQKCWNTRNKPKKNSRNKEMLEKTCLWCREKFKTPFPTKLYCCFECRTAYNKMKRKIFKLHYFEDTLKLRLELQEKGKDFVLR